MGLFVLFLIKLANKTQPKGYPTTAQLALALDIMDNTKMTAIGIVKFSNRNFCNSVNFI